MGLLAQGTVAPTGATQPKESEKWNGEEVPYCPGPYGG